jgi:hypothetical protein
VVVFWDTGWLLLIFPFVSPCAHDRYQSVCR